MGFIRRLTNELITPNALRRLANRPSQQPLYNTRFEATIGLHRLEVDIPCGFTKFNLDNYPYDYFKPVLNLQNLEYESWGGYQKAHEFFVFIWDYKTRFLLGNDAWGDSGKITFWGCVTLSDEPINSLSELEQVIDREYQRVINRRIEEEKARDTSDYSDWDLEMHEMRINPDSYQEDRPKNMQKTTIGGQPGLFYEMNQVGGYEYYYALLLGEYHYLVISLRTSGGVTDIPSDKRKAAYCEDIEHLVGGIRFYPG